MRTACGGGERGSEDVIQFEWSQSVREGEAVRRGDGGWMVAATGSGGGCGGDSGIWCVGGGSAVCRTSPRQCRKGVEGVFVCCFWTAGGRAGCRGMGPVAAAPCNRLRERKERDTLLVPKLLLKSKCANCRYSLHGVVCGICTARTMRP